MTRPLLLLVALLSFSFSFSLACSRGESDAEDAKAPAAAPPARARVAVAQDVVFEDELELPARVAPPPDRDASVGSAAGGRIAQIAVSAGGLVKKGDVLARLDETPLRRALDAASAAESTAEATRDERAKVAARTASLVERGVASRQDAETDAAAQSEAEAALAQARAAAAEARRLVGAATVRAPFDGVVVTILRHEGEDVDAGEPIVEVAAMHPVELVASCAAPDLARLAMATGPRASVTAAGITRPASLISAARSVDPATGRGEARFGLVVEEQGQDLVFGESAVVHAVVGERHAVAVPPGALRRGPAGGDQVVVAKDGVASVRDVKVGARRLEEVEIVEGVGAGEEVVVDDPVGIEDGATLEIAR